MTSTRAVVEVVGQSRYDITVTSDVQTLATIKVSPFGLDCNLTMTSANGSSPTWQVQTSLVFFTDAESGVYRIAPSDVVVTDVEDEDWEISGGFLCESINFESQGARDAYVGTLVAHFDSVGSPLCAAPGPAYLGPCAEQP